MRKYIVFLAISMGIGSSFKAQEIIDPIVPEKEIRTYLPFVESEQNLFVSEYDGMFIFEGDILVNERGRGGTAISKEKYLWEESTIPYQIEDDHPMKDPIKKAIKKLNSETNLCLIPRNGNESIMDYVVFKYKSGVCGLSYVGKQGGRQVIYIGDMCGNTMGSTIHEIMHAAGFYHEHTHPEREKFIKIHEGNIASKKALNQNFKIRGRKVTRYDYYSIMHYGEKAFGNGKITITTLDPRFQKVIGQRRDLSSLDVFSIDTLYPKPGKCEKGPRMSSFAVDIEYPDVELVPQLSKLSCWAAAISMIIGWVDKVSIIPEDIADQIGYWKQYEFGLPPEDLKALNEWGFEIAAPVSYTVDGLAELLRTGPLWVATLEEFSKNKKNPHVRVITGMTGDGSPKNTLLTIYDPWKKGMTKFRLPNNGSIYQETFAEFSRKQSDLVVEELNKKTMPIYIAHLPFTQ